MGSQEKEDKVNKQKPKKKKVDWNLNILIITLGVNGYMLIKGDLQTGWKISLVIYFLLEIYFKYIDIGKWKVKA